MTMTKVKMMMNEAGRQDSINRDDPLPFALGAAALP